MFIHSLIFAGSSSRRGDSVTFSTIVGFFGTALRTSLALQNLPSVISRCQPSITITQTHLDNISTVATLGRFSLGVSQQNFVHIRARELEQFAVGRKHDESDFAAAKDGEFVGFLHQTEFTFGEGDLLFRFDATFVVECGEGTGG